MRHTIVLLIAAAFAATACGTKGPLTLPPRDVVAKPAPAAADNNSPPSSTAR